MIVFVMFLHWLADFVCQSRWMAENKSKNWWALGLHVLTYTLIMTWGFMWIMMLLPTGTLTKVAVFALLTAVSHFATDAVTSRVNAHAWYNEQDSLFWNTVGFDQWVHLTTLYLTLHYLGVSI